MNSKSILWRTLAGLILVAILAGCSTATPTLAPTPTQAPTTNPQPTFDAIASQAAATVIANLTLTAPTATMPPTATNTPAVTNTPAFTSTPLPPTATATLAFIPWTKTPTTAPADYACSVTGVSPASSTAIKVGSDFDANWTLKNTGVKTWVSSDIDVRYSSGEKFQKNGKDIYDLPGDVAPNGTTTIVVDMIAPANDGTHTAVWVVNFPDGNTCTLNLKINVTK
jgi:hypothetical protein